MARGRRAGLPCVELMLLLFWSHDDFGGRNGPTDSQGRARVGPRSQDNFRLKLGQVQTIISPAPFIGFHFLP